jgi:hypothetical protein
MQNNETIVYREKQEDGIDKEIMIALISLSGSMFTAILTLCGVFLNQNYSSSEKVEIKKKENKKIIISEKKKIQDSLKILSVDKKSNVEIKNMLVSAEDKIMMKCKNDLDNNSKETNIKNNIEKNIYKSSDNELEEKVEEISKLIQDEVINITNEEKNIEYTGPCEILETKLESIPFLGIKVNQSKCNEKRIKCPYCSKYFCPYHFCPNNHGAYGGHVCENYKG